MSNIDKLIQEAIQVLEDMPRIVGTTDEIENQYTKNDLAVLVKIMNDALDDVYEIIEKM